MLLSDPDRHSIDRILSTVTDVFSELVALTGLRPELDFVDADLRGVDFRGSHLAKFNFEYADLRGANWADSKGEPSHYRFALRGSSSDAISARDIDKWARAAKFSRTWSERFFAFKCIVDNFGENYLTLDLLREIGSRDKSTYMRSASALYLAASLYRIEEVKSYCKELAAGSNSRINMFRMTKIRRYAREISKVVASIPVDSKPPGYFDPKELRGDLERIWQRE